VKTKRPRKGPGRGLAAAALVLGAALLASVQASALSPTVSIGSVTVAPSEEATVNLEALDIGAPGLGAWTIDIVYDPSVVTAVACDPHEDALCNPGFASNRVRVTGASATGLQGDTVLAAVTFQCNGTGSSSLTPAIVNIDDATLGGPEEISVAVQAGNIACAGTGPPLLGDANCDGMVNSIDATFVLQFVAGRIDAVPCPTNADVDGNGRIDAVDAALILQIDAGLWSPGT
jgi:hypothetical protein